MIVLFKIENFSSFQTRDARLKTMPRSPVRQMEERLAENTEAELSIKSGVARGKPPSKKM